MCSCDDCTAVPLRVVSEQFSILLLFSLSIVPISKALREPKEVQDQGTWVHPLLTCSSWRPKSVLWRLFIAYHYAGLVDRLSCVEAMELGLRKCATVHVKWGKLVDMEEYFLSEERTIEQVARGGTYQYLGIEQLFKPDHNCQGASAKNVCETLSLNMVI